MINKNSELARGYYENGKFEGCYILDFHAHMHNTSSMYFPAFSPELMIGVMERCGAKLTVFCSHKAMTYAAFEEEFNLDVAKRYPDKFLAYHAVIPGQTDYAAAAARMDANREFYFGFKFHPDSDKTKLTDEKYRPFHEYLDRNGLPALVHTWGLSEFNGVDELETVSELYPNATYICGHSFHGDWKNGAAMMKDHPNLYAELTAVMDNQGAIELLCDVVGSDRVLFGTDVPWFDTHHGIGAVLSADINDEDRRNIFYRNGEKLLAKQNRKIVI